jgi:hypothetical protein
MPTFNKGYLDNTPNEVEVTDNNTRRMDMMRKIVKKASVNLPNSTNDISRKKNAILYLVGIPFDENQINYIEPFTERAKAELFVADYQVKHGKRVYIEEIDLIELYS